MAGIGFELKKLFQKRGLAATAKAYGYAGVICTGPMLLGIVLLVGIAFICDHTGATRHNRELLNCMIPPTTSKIAVEPQKEESTASWRSSYSISAIYLVTTIEKKLVTVNEARSV